ncbi:homoserine O-acetyltransferase family protein [Runella aurantiaca]|uniref:Homoserine O-acetyltransferase n=1 Tax=Runella aurantiaca TaxID=2282308 RepID=A0A369IFU3_9BACT|nr:homoserine O-acetyltransferase [Runella aurantiaca]RDB07720.1 homoserine O-acetyltransferase [Runella aurantiaca]
MAVTLFKYPYTFPLELGGELAGFQLAYTTHGTRNADSSNVLWICHALTGSSDPTDWWDGLVGPGLHYDPKDWFIICVNVLGSHYGSTNALSINTKTKAPYFQSFPDITIRDNIYAFELLREHLGIEHIHTLAGGSLGGQQALEWAIIKPDLIEKLVLIATNALHSPWGIAFNESQRMAIKADPTWQEARPDAGIEGMKVARSIALLSYRNYDTYDFTQARDSNEQTDHFRAATYQQYQGDKLAHRFNAFSYWTLSRMMDLHNVGRNRPSVTNALSLVKAHTLVVGISSDILFQPSEQKFLARHIPDAEYQEIDSLYGHDGFLIEYKQLKQILQAWETKGIPQGR